MKCVFAATPHRFTVQYHADALVASHADKAWVVDMDGTGVSYRRQACQDFDGKGHAGCAVFVPSAMGRRDASRLLAAFKTAHPGVIPPHLVFRFSRIAGWLRDRRSLPPRLDWYH